VPSLYELSNRLWAGQDKTSDKGCHPFAPLYQIEEVSDGVAFYKGFSNLAAIRTDAGLSLIDTGSFHPVAQGRIFEKLRSWSEEPIHTAVYTHGHADHAYGLPPFLAEARDKGWQEPEIIGHSLVRARMDRYIHTAGFNSLINTRQFGHEQQWPTDPIYPTKTYDSALELEVGGVAFELHHARGETDDHTWVFLPGKKVLYTGDLFIWAAPNAGNPQKVQRYALDWIQALRQMSQLGAEVLLCGHGLPVFGANRVQQALSETADYLQSLLDQTLTLMNEGASLDAITRAVQPPADLAERPYLQPVYDEPEFIVRNIWRCYGGWYNDRPSDLKPAPTAAIASEIATLAGGVGRLVERAREHQTAGEMRLACHLIDWAAEAEPDSREVHAARAAIYTQRNKAETSTMAKGIFRAASVDSDKRAG